MAIEVELASCDLGGARVNPKFADSPPFAECSRQNQLHPSVAGEPLHCRIVVSDHRGIALIALLSEVELDDVVQTMRGKRCWRITLEGNANNPVTLPVGVMLHRH